MLRRLIVAAVILDVVISMARALERRNIDAYVAKFAETFQEIGRESFIDPERDEHQCCAGVGMPA